MSSLNNRQSGFAAVGIATLIAVLAIIGVAGFEVYKNQNKTDASTANTTPATTVSPAQTTKEPNGQTMPSKEYEGLTKYTNSRYRFSFYYPKE